MADDTVIIREKKDSTSELSGAVVLTETIKSLSGVLTELIRAGQSSPMLSAIVGLIAGDVLQKVGVISAATNAEIRIMVLGATGVSITADLLNKIDGLLPFTSGGSNPSLLTPSGQVFVYGSNSADPQLNALLQQLISKTKP